MIPLDTETGALTPEKGDLLTIYISVVDENFKILDELDLKLKPNDGRLPVTEVGAMKVNGIDLQKHMADPATITYTEAGAQIVSMLKKHLKKNGRYSNLIPMAHNANFDLSFIYYYLLPKEEWEKYCHYRIIDTSPIVWLFKDAQWWPSDLSNLGSIVDFLGIPKRQAHTAKDDVLMMVDVYRKILEIMKAKKENSGTSQDLISLLEAE